MPRLYFIRHACPDSPPDVLNGRRPGVNLSAASAGALERLATGLAPSPPEQLYTSPLERTRQTAEFLARQWQVPCEPAAELIELDFGAWTGRRFPELQAEPVWGRFTTFRSGTRIPQGETMVEVQARVIGLVLRLRDAFPDRRIGLVSHGDVIRAALLFLLGMPVDLIERLRIDMGSVTTVDISDQGAQVVQLNGLSGGP